MIKQGSLAIAVESTKNAKLGDCSATYVTLSACDPKCPMIDACYGLHSYVGIISRQLEPEGYVSPTAIARVHAEAISRLSGWTPLRLHVVGDSRTATAARIVAAAARKYKRKHDAPVWGYTHSWEYVSRYDWEGVSMLASCESVDQLEDAHSRGYAVALVVDEFESESAYPIGDTGWKVLPCPAMTRKITCSECLLCADDVRLHERKLAIGFEAHGSGRRKALEVISVGGAK